MGVKLPADGEELAAVTPGCEYVLDHFPSFPLKSRDWLLWFGVVSNHDILAGSGVVQKASALKSGEILSGRNRAAIVDLFT